MTEETMVADRRVLHAIDGLVARGKRARFRDIYIRISALDLSEKQIDRSLQRMRKLGVIEFWHEFGWART